MVDFCTFEGSKMLENFALYIRARLPNFSSFMEFHSFRSQNEFQITSAFDTCDLLEHVDYNHFE